MQGYHKGMGVANGNLANKENFQDKGKEKRNRLKTKRVTNKENWRGHH